MTGRDPSSLLACRLLACCLLACRLLGGVRAAFARPALLLKAASFAAIGVVNGLVNFAVFWLALQGIAGFPALVGNAGIVLANIVAWLAAVSGSYVMNALVTFAAESGRRLSVRAYLGFAVSGMLGLVTDTAALLVAMEFMPLLLAKLVAIGAGFLVNFSMSYFVVFRPK